MKTYRILACTMMLLSFLGVFLSEAASIQAALGAITLAVISLREDT